MMEIEGFDEATVSELRNRARDALLVQAIASEEQAENLDPALLGLEGMDKDLATKLARSGVKTRDDLADLATDDLVEMAGVDAERAKSLDRKSTRLNSSHSQISYAVFCLKKKKRENMR